MSSDVGLSLCSGCLDQSTKERDRSISHGSIGASVSAFLGCGGTYGAMRTLKKVEVRSMQGETPTNGVFIESERGSRWGVELDGPATEDESDRFRATDMKRCVPNGFTRGVCD